MLSPLRKVKQDKNATKTQKHKTTQKTEYHVNNFGTF
jgi:hypothetical protein